MPTRWVSAQIAGLLLVTAPLAAQSLPPITIGGGLRTSFIHTSPDEADDTDAFVLDSARLYVNGPVTDTIKFMFNTEYDGSSNKIGVLDAVARLEMAPKFNIWMGRFLPPSDRANLYGPYYSHHWGVYTDGLQNGHPFVFQGRDVGCRSDGAGRIAHLSDGAQRHGQDHAAQVHHGPAARGLAARSVSAIAIFEPCPLKAAPRWASGTYRRAARFFRN